MAAPNTNYVTAGKPKVTGGALRAPLGSTLPTDSKSTLDPAFKAQGYVGDGGLKQKPDIKVDKTRAWGGQVVHVSQTEYGETYSLTLICSRDKDVLATVYGDGNVTDGTDGALVVRHTGDERNGSVWVFDMKAGKGRRIVVPNGKISDIGDITYADKDVIGYALTIDALPDESGVSSYEYIEGDPVTP